MLRTDNALLLFVAAVALLCGGTLSAQNHIGGGGAHRLYQRLCADCHGTDLRGAMSSSLVDEQWAFGSSDDAIARSIRDGLPDLGMPGFGDNLTEEEIRSLVIYIREGKRIARQEDETHAPAGDGTFHSQEASFRVEQIAEIPGIPWSIAFLPDESALITQRDGTLWRLRDGAIAGKIEQTPQVWHGGQGGLLDVAPHPNFTENGWIYLAYSHSPDGNKGMTRIVRGRIHEDRWGDQQVIWEAPADLHLPTRHHFGSRIAFNDGYLFFTVGDRGRQESAQDLSRPNGKVFRLHEDGRVPEDNPFDSTEALPGVWSYGHRNPQGLDVHPETGDLWSTEHGPRGGDEVNRVKPGTNYGWPVITYGMNYDGSPITAHTKAPGMEQPEHQWTPSIAPCGSRFYTGDVFPAWKNNFFVTGLASQELHRLVIENDSVVHAEIVLSDQGRLRDVATGPDGYLYLLAEGPQRNTSGSRPGLVLRLAPTR